MIAPLQVLLVDRGTEPSARSRITEPLRRAGYEPTVEAVDSAERLGRALATGGWDAVLVTNPPDGLSTIDVLAWLQRCRISTPLIAVVDDAAAADALRQAGVSEVVERTQGNQLGLAVARARNPAGAGERTSFRAIASQVPVAVHRTGVDGRVLFANAALARLLGVESADDVVGRHMQFDFGYPRDAFFAEIQRTGEVSNLRSSWQSPTGGPLLVRETAWARRDLSGRVLFYEGLIEAMPHPGHAATVPAPAEPGQPTTAAPEPVIAERATRGPDRRHVAEQPGSVRAQVARGRENGTVPTGGGAAPVRASSTTRTEPSGPGPRPANAGSSTRFTAPPPSPGGDVNHLYPSADDFGFVPAGVDLPYLEGSVPGASRRKRQEEVPPPPVEVEQPPKRPRMLVVEDNLDTRQLLQRVLKPYYEFDMVADAHSAIERLKKRHYDVLLMDIHLGGKETGADVLHVARGLPGYEKTTAIAVTAYALPGDRDALLEAGFDGYVSKPFTVQTLLAALGRASGVASQS